MAKTCNGCGSEKKTKTPDSVPYLVHETAMARNERTVKRLFVLILVLILLLVGTNIAWLVYESQFETVETTNEEYQIEQDSENGNNNSVINGGEIVNG